jgi:capsular exopolysaccharide synthesis family protein
MVEQLELIDDVPDAPTADAFAAFMRFLRAAWMRKGIIAACVLVCCAVGGFRYSTAIRLYESTAQILVINTGSEVLRSADGSMNPRNVQSHLPTHVRIVASDKVIGQALAELPREYRIDVRGIPAEKQFAAIRRRLNVSTVKQTNLINVSYRSVDPEAAAVVVDAIIAAYQQFMNEMHKDKSGEFLEILSHEKAAIERALLETESELIRLRSESEIVISGDSQINEITLRYHRLAITLSDAQSTTIDARAQLAAISAAIRKGEDIQPYLTQSDQSLARHIMMKEIGLETRQEWAVDQRQRQLVQDTAKLQEKQDVYGPNHPIITQLENRIASTRQWLTDHRYVVARSARMLRDRELTPRLLAMAEQQVAQSVEHERAIRLQVDQIKPHAINLNNQMAKIETLGLDMIRLRSSYDVLLERMKDIDLGKDNGLRTSIVDEPKVSKSPVSPKLPQIAMLSLFAGLGIGFSLVYLLDLLDDRFRSPEEIKSQLGTPVLAMIRHLEELPGQGIETVHTFARPNSVAVESFRTLRTVISFSDTKPRRILITSSEPSDGKSTVISNLSVAFAQAGQRTLLIDADMRRPGITAMIDLARKQGLSTILREQQPISDIVRDCLHASGTDCLDIIPAGPRPQNPAELLAGVRFAELLEWAETEYDQILIDGPPVMAVADPTIIGRLADATILVINPEKNRRRVLFRVMESLRSVKLPLLGVVVNNVTADGTTDYNGYGYGYGYGYGNGAGYGYGAEPDLPGDELAADVHENEGSAADTTGEPSQETSGGSVQKAA